MELLLLSGGVLDKHFSIISSLSFYVGLLHLLHFLALFHLEALKRHFLWIIWLSLLVGAACILHFMVRNFLKRSLLVDILVLHH